MIIDFLRSIPLDQVKKIYPWQAAEMVRTELGIELNSDSPIHTINKGLGLPFKGLRGKGAPNAHRSALERRVESLEAKVRELTEIVTAPNSVTSNSNGSRFDLQSH